jgi:hypothetical protein
MNVRVRGDRHRLPLERFVQRPLVLLERRTGRHVHSRIGLVPDHVDPQCCFSGHGRCGIFELPQGQVRNRRIAPLVWIGRFVRYRDRCGAGGFAVQSRH